MTAFGITLPGRILFGRGEVARAPALIVGFGQKVLVVHGATTRHADWLSAQIAALGGEVRRLACPAEPTLQMVNAALEGTRAFAPQVVVGMGGGSALDLAKALAALIPAPGGAMDHLEVVGKGAALFVDPLPFVAIPTTAGTGAEATKNAVIGLPDHRRKVSLRDDRMLARIAIVDPALTDGCPWPVTLASGLDALVQVIEPFVSCRATRFTDALTLPCISLGLAALRVLQSGEDPAARDNLAWVSHCGGLALANAGLGAVHGLAGPIGGVSSAPHGAVCGALISPVLAVNLARARQTQNTTALARLDQVCALIADGLGGPVDAAPQTLARWITAVGLPGLSAQGFAAKDHDDVASAALGSSSMKGNPVALSKSDLVAILETEAR